MRDHYCLHNKRQRKQALKELDRLLLHWRTEFWLRAWEFHVETVDERWSLDDGTIDVALSVRTVANPDYKRAKFLIWMDDEGCVDQRGLEDMACHEMLHVALSPIAHGYEKVLEDQLTESEMTLILPLLHGPEEGVIEDLTFNLVEAKLAEDLLKKYPRRRKKKTRAKKTPAGS